MVSTGLVAKGYTTFIVDEPCFAGRDANGSLVANSTQWPSGFASFGKYLAERGMQLGIYTDAGTEAHPHPDSSLSLSVAPILILASSSDSVQFVQPSVLCVQIEALMVISCVLRCTGGVSSIGLSLSLYHSSGLSLYHSDGLSLYHSGGLSFCRFFCVSICLQSSLCCVHIAPRLFALRYASISLNHSTGVPSGLFAFWYI